MPIFMGSAILDGVRVRPSSVGAQGPSPFGQVEGRRSAARFSGRQRGASLLDAHAADVAILCRLDPRDEIALAVGRKAVPSRLRFRRRLQREVKVKGHDGIAARATLSFQELVACDLNPARPRRRLLWSLNPADEVPPSNRREAVPDRLYGGCGGKCFAEVRRLFAHGGAALFQSDRGDHCGDEREEFGPPGRRRSQAMKASKRVSKTELLAATRCLDWKAVRSALARRQDLLRVRDERGRNLLHLCCGLDLAKRRSRVADAVRTAGVLLDAGLDVNAEAFRERDWKATPLWYAVGRGRNLRLAKYLLSRGASPNHCSWAAAFNDDAPAIRWLCSAGAEDLDAPGRDTPLMFAVKWSRFKSAKALLECGADPNVTDRRGMTPLHSMLKKRSDPKYVRMFLQYGASVDMPDREGRTVRAILARARDERYRRLLAASTSRS